MVSKPEFYKWSSYSVYIGKITDKFCILNTNYLLSIISSDKIKAIYEYKRFVSNNNLFCKSYYRFITSESTQEIKKYYSDIANIILKKYDSNYEIAIKKIRENTELSLREISSVTKIPLYRVNKILHH